MTATGQTEPEHRAGFNAGSRRHFGQSGAWSGRLPAAVTEHLGVSGRELAGLGAILVVAAVLRFANLPVRGGWDSDQGTEMIALRSALAAGRLPTFGPEAISVASSFHHGALYYDLLLPAAWLGNGDPTWVVAEIALLSLLVVPIAWWIARSIGGPPAGLTAALLAAVSASLIGYATFIWNPTLVEPGAAVAFLGAWQAIRTRRAGWWVVAAAGSAVAVQSHVAAAVIIVPLGVAFILDLRRGPAARRARIAALGLAGVALVIVSYIPLIAYELTHDFADTRGILAYFTDPGSASAAGSPVRVLFAAIRILAWPLTRWPLLDRLTAAGVALTTALVIAVGLVWRVRATNRPGATESADASRPDKMSGDVGSDAPDAIESLGVRLIGGWLLLSILTLGVGLRSVSEVQGLPTEQYHVVADVLVFVAAGLIAGGLWRSLPGRAPTVARRVAVVVAVGGLVAWNAGHWPLLTSTDGGWPAAQAAAARLERDAAGSSMAIVPMFREKGSDAYLYPLSLDGFTVVAPERAGAVILLCDEAWITGCGGPAEATWIGANPAGTGLTLVDRFAAAPDRLLSVYVRAP